MLHSKHILLLKIRTRFFKTGTKFSKVGTRILKKGGESIKCAHFGTLLVWFLKIWHTGFLKIGAGFLKMGIFEIVRNRY